ncbi:unnamed protein product, partial [Phaeothamnion confervicola]
AAGRRPNPGISREDFDACIRELLPRFLPRAEAADLAETLHGVFDAYDRRGCGAAPMRDVLAGLSFLCGGSKSSKLAVSAAF